MTVFGDLDISSIAELPSGRVPIESFVVPLADKPGWMPRVWQRLAEELGKGRQVFVVCPAIDATHSDDALAPEGAGAPLPVGAGPGSATLKPNQPATVLATIEHLRALPQLSSARIEALHGRMSSDEKDRVMQDFASGALDVLVATTVIEVGVDVPNASMMVILDADRFGVSQLHQLRLRSWHPPSMVSSSRNAIWSCGRKVTCSAACSRVVGQACGCCASSRTRS
jgi:ATP-dependent DNA helicase RecG